MRRPKVDLILVPPCNWQLFTEIVWYIWMLPVLFVLKRVLTTAGNAYGYNLFWFRVMKFVRFLWGVIFNILRT